MIPESDPSVRWNSVKPIQVESRWNSDDYKEEENFIQLLRVVFCFSLYMHCKASAWSVENVWGLDEFERDRFPLSEVDLERGEWGMSGLERRRVIAKIFWHVSLVPPHPTKVPPCFNINCTTQMYFYIAKCRVLKKTKCWEFLVP